MNPCHASSPPPSKNVTDMDRPIRYSSLTLDHEHLKSINHQTEYQLPIYMVVTTHETTQHGKPADHNPFTAD